MVGANRYVIVSGLPASGKSTLARALARALSLPVLDKDDFLEALFDSVDVDARLRSKLSRAADQEFRERAERSSGAILTSWWKHPQSALQSGTPTEWLAFLPGLQVEAHCKCSPAVAAQRFVSRERHPGHLDGRWSYAELLTSFERQASLGPLGLKYVVEIQTEDGFEINTVLHGIAQAFDAATL